MSVHADQIVKSTRQTGVKQMVKRQDSKSNPLTDNRPKSVTQLMIQAGKDEHNSGCSCPSCSGASLQAKSKGTLQLKSGEVVQMVCPHGKANKKKCPACQQSIDARNVNKLRMYQTPAKGKVQKQREEAVKGKSGSIAHGFGKKGSGQSSKMDQILDEVNGKKKKK